MQVETEQTLITPGLAEDWLTGNTHNRAMKPRVIKNFKADILANNVRPTHQGIAFTNRTPQKILVDGQNRLKAIYELGQEGQTDIQVLLPVSYGVPLESQEVIDTGATRTVIDALVIQGKKASGGHKAIANMMNAGRKGMSVREQVTYITKYWSSIEFAFHLLYNGSSHHRGLNISALGAAAARAVQCGHPRYQVKEFVHLVIKGDQSDLRDRQGLALTLRRWMRDQAMKEQSSEAAGKSEIYWRCVFTLEAWLKNRDTWRSTEVRQPFVLPGETW